MHILRKGFFYTVYDIGNGSVLKKKRNYLASLCMHLFRNGKGPQYIKKSLHSSALLIQHIPDSSIIAHPRIVSGYDYEQDLVVTLQDYFLTHTDTECLACIRAYSEHVYMTWHMGFADVVYNFTMNCGVDSDGKVVLFDFNEITFDKERVARDIRERRWARSWTIRFHLRKNKALRNMIIDELDRSLTLSKLEEFWQDGAYV